ncbi:DUF397 domain-containing protein [Streptomyces sp. PTM05]|uniref:DUF397 domain-containing protein n=1 Tax=Streptantibioticus parmotrematis TaxID=2873249 RepID=A0ABS7QUN0_9ACTN|nr:DUF397 domain-containing protein [Streptantibioticus parmotrematis]MBY8886913.1 DUF397 domain-containing protein [Streptantibioticus parmotrematis]
MSVPFDRSAARWERSSYSNANGGQCVEFARTFASDGVIPVRDSKDPHGPALTFSPAAWSAFTDAVKRGELPAV